MDLSGPNDQRAITRDHVNRFRRTLDALEAEDDGGCNCRGLGTGLDGGTLVLGTRA